ncbi:MAG: hypothetical protein NXI12_11625 [Alphaproteobacteria bacterium]|nr:hypothetical protein [Alphaproteobacteria bacterium]
MTRLVALALITLTAPALSGCLVIKTVDVAAGAAGAVIGAAGDVAEGAVDVVTPGGDDDDDGEKGGSEGKPADAPAHLS